MMEGVRKGGDRQELHEAIRVHSHAAAAVVKQEGKPNDLLERIKADSIFSGLDVDALTKPELFIGRAAQQVVEFVENVIDPLRSTESGDLSVEIKV